MILKIEHFIPTKKFQAAFHSVKLFRLFDVTFQTSLKKGSKELRRFSTSCDRWALLLLLFIYNTNNLWMVHVDLPLYDGKWTCQSDRFKGRPIESLEEKKKGEYLWMFRKRSPLCLHDSMWQSSSDINMDRSGGRHDLLKETFEDIKSFLREKDWKGLPPGRVVATGHCTTPFSTWGVCVQRIHPIHMECPLAMSQFIHPVDRASFWWMQYGSTSEQLSDLWSEHLVKSFNSHLCLDEDRWLVLQ